MLLESRINERTTLVIDAESVGGIDKGALSTRSHPDTAIPAVMAAIRAVAETLGEAARVGGSAPPSGMEVTFTVRIDSNAVVSVARTPDAGQFRVTLKWAAAP
ncbi:MAG: CU044_2847 family protein [Pseudomonadota bacterium]|nr:CU044_2847 family protein [Pseudomonadota bacterium]